MFWPRKTGPLTGGKNEFLAPKTTKTGSFRFFNIRPHSRPGPDWPLAGFTTTFLDQITKNCGEVSFCSINCYRAGLGGRGNRLHSAGGHPTASAGSTSASEGTIPSRVVSSGSVSLSLAPNEPQTPLIKLTNAKDSGVWWRTTANQRSFRWGSFRISAYKHTTPSCIHEYMRLRTSLWHKANASMGVPEIQYPGMGQRGLA